MDAKRIDNGNKCFDNGDKKNSIAKPKTTRQINEKVKSTVFEQPGKKNQNKKIENVLILQGGGSLGAFACGVFKAISTNHIKLDIVAGTSIGGVNAAIIAGSKNEEHPEQELEKFWLELSDSFVDLDKTVWPFPSIRKNMKQSLASGYYTHYFPFFPEHGVWSEKLKADEELIKIKQLRAFFSAAMFGVDNMFIPRWRKEPLRTDPEYFETAKWSYIYDHLPLAKTLEKYVDFDRLRPGGNPHARLIVTAVNVLTAEPLIFDSSTQQITPKHILATSAYPLYNFPWVEVNEGIYAWDGGLLSNTPLREVIEASPAYDKQILLVENYPKKVDALPTNLPEVYHRARDIIFCDKTEHNAKMAKVITRYLGYIQELYQLLEDNIDRVVIDKRQLERIRRKYIKFKRERGAEVKSIFYITRDERFPHVYENADFSPDTIRNSIMEGELKTYLALKNKGLTSTRHN
jgi:NTE family protein